MILGFRQVSLRIGLATIFSIIAIGGVDRLTQMSLRHAGEEVVLRYLQEGLSPHVLGDDALAPDALALSLWIQQANLALTGTVISMNARLGTMDTIQILSVGDVSARRESVSGDLLGGRPRTVAWRSHGQAYEADWGASYRRHWAVLAAVGAITLVAMGLIAWLIPIPLSQERLHWYDRLRANGVGSRAALRAARHPRLPPEGLSDVEDHRVQQLAERGVDWSVAMDWVLREDIADLGEHNWEWFLFGLARWQGDFGQAIALAQAPDSIEIRFEPPSLHVRGIPVEISKTPLTYFALYARRRQGGEGWVDNPPSTGQGSSKSDSLAQDFIGLANQFTMEPPAADTVKTSGVTAKALHTNRNRIKDNITAALGGSAKLAAPYLFEDRPTERGDRKACRLKLPPEAITIA
jgi:hypothetical protein